MNKNAGFRKVYFVVCAETTEEVLIGYSDLKNLGAVPPDWPRNLETNIDINRSVTTNQGMIQAKLALFAEFEDVISDTISDKPMNCSPMVIRLRTDIEVVPRKVTTASRIPLHQEEEAENMVEDLMDKNILAKVHDEPVKFVSRGLFMPKATGNLRLVTDYMYVNQFIDRPVHPFPSTKEVIEGIRPDWKFFIKMD